MLGSARSKYNVAKDKTKRTYKGVVYDSEAEMKFYKDFVEPRLESGEIVRCDRQEPFELIPKYDHEGDHIRSVIYRADFVLFYEDGREEVIDIKGCPDAVALLKRKLFWYRYPDKKYIWLCYSKKDGGWVEYDLVQERRRREKKRREDDNYE